MVCYFGATGIAWPSAMGSTQTLLFKVPPPNVSHQMFCYSAALKMVRDLLELPSLALKANQFQKRALKSFNKMKQLPRRRTNNKSSQMCSTSLLVLI